MFHTNHSMQLQLVKEDFKKIIIFLEQICNWMNFDELLWHTPTIVWSELCFNINFSSQHLWSNLVIYKFGLKMFILQNCPKICMRIDQ